MKGGREDFKREKKKKESECRGIKRDYRYDF